MQGRNGWNKDNRSVVRIVGHAARKYQALKGDTLYITNQITAKEL